MPGTLKNKGLDPICRYRQTEWGQFTIVHFEKDPANKSKDVKANPKKTNSKQSQNDVKQTGKTQGTARGTRAVKVTGQTSQEKKEKRHLNTLKRAG